MASKNLTTIRRGKKVVNVDHTNKTNKTVTILFKSRTGQRFDLPNGHAIHLNGNGVHLHDALGGILPVGGQTVNVVDKDDWTLCKKTWGAIFKPWFEHGIIEERNNEEEAKQEAIERADEKTGDDPVDLTPVEDKE